MAASPTVASESEGQRTAETIIPVEHPGAGSTVHRRSRPLKISSVSSTKFQHSVQEQLRITSQTDGVVTAVNLPRGRNHRAHEIVVAVQPDRRNVVRSATSGVSKIVMRRWPHHPFGDTFAGLLTLLSRQPLPQDRRAHCGQTRSSCSPPRGLAYANPANLGHIQ
jgi:hypothetical protein